MKLVVYLAGPILGCTDEECKGWRNRMAEQLPEITFLDPMRRDYRDFETMETATEIVEDDIADINASDAVLVFHDRPSVGTAMEAFYAFREGKYVLTVNALEENEHPDTNMYPTKMSPWMLYHSSEIVNSLEEAIEKLRAMAQDVWDAGAELLDVQEDVL